MNVTHLYMPGGHQKPIPTAGVGNKIGMDTKRQREGLHLWIGKHTEVDGKDTFDERSVHLTREDARNLIKEIEQRLF